MIKIEKFLLAKRFSDSTYLALHETPAATSEYYVTDPIDAKRITWNGTSPIRIPAYYFENSARARDIWLKGCIMVPFEIITTIHARELL